MSRSTALPAARRLAALGLCASVMLGLGACSSNDSTTTSTTVKPTTTAAADTDSTEVDDTVAEPDDEQSAEGDASAVTVSSGEAAPENTIIFDADGTMGTTGSFSPSELTLPVGEKVTFKAAPNSGVHAVRFGTSTDTYTITEGLIETFTISEPGTYTVTEDITGTTMTLTVV